MAKYKKKNSKSSASAKSKSKKHNQNTIARNREIAGIIIFALGVLLLVGVLLAKDGGLGAIGGFFAKLMYTLAGQAAIVFPIFLLVFGALVFADRFVGVWNKRLLGLCVVMLAILGLLHMGNDVSSWQSCMAEAVQGAGGGVIGAFFAFLLCKAFGTVLSKIILVFALLIGVLLLTQLSLKKLFTTVAAWVSNFFSGLRPTDEELQEQERSRQERQKRAEQRKSSGKDNVAENSAAGRAARGKKYIFDANAENDFAIEKPVGASRIFVPDSVGSSVYSPLVDDAAEIEGEIFAPDKNAFSHTYLPDVSSEGDSDTGIAAVSETAAVGQASVDGQPFKPQNGENAVDEAFPESGQGGDMPHEYILPQPELMSMPVNIKNPRMEKAITDSVGLLEETLANFGIKATVTQVVAGPAITRYEVQPAPGVKVSKIAALTNDIALSLAAPDVRIEAPIPGRSVVGIEVPRPESSIVYFREVIESEAFKNAKSKISFALGKDISGNYIIGDLAKMPHLLVAGATGTGKSVCINSFICSILYKAKPDEVKFLLIDPKKVEMSNYAGLPHLNSPVVTDVKKAAASLKWVVSEMENRYDVFSSEGVRNFDEYNDRNPEKKFCHIVVIIDELADLMMTAKDDVEQPIVRLAQMARAAGIHLVIATQRPSKSVLTGLIKANVPSRIAFAVSSNIDSRIILDENGAERLIGKGDMLYSPIGSSKPLRVQGTYISDKDVEQLVAYCKAQARPQYCEAASAVMEAVGNEGNTSAASHERTADDKDPLFYEAARLILSTGQASTSYLQRRFSIGNPRAGRLIDCLADNGVVGGPDGSKPRAILMTLEQFEEKFGNEQ